MDGKDLTILLVEDDALFARSVQEAFTRAGYKVLHFSKPQEALALAKRHDFCGAVIDCMLPQMSGVDLCEKLREAWGAQDVPLVLVSGIYKDKGFIRDAISKTSATTFLVKPFEVSQLVSLFKNELQAEGGDENPIMDLISRPLASQRDKRKYLEAMDRISGYDLPFIYSLILDSGLSGQLVITTPNKKVSGISFSQGTIVQVDMEDSDTFIGSLLIERGFVSAADVRNVIPTLNNRKIGEVLVANSLVSPHFLPVVLAEQMVIRLGKLIQQDSVAVNFNVSTVPSNEAFIDVEQFTPYLHDWISSKLKATWLQSFYRPCMDQILIRGPEYKPDHIVWALSLLRDMPELNAMLNNNLSLQQLLDIRKYPEEDVLKAIHLLILRRILTFNRSKQFDLAAFASRVKKIKDELDHTKTLFEALDILGLSQRAAAEDVKKAYREFAKTYHPDKLPSNCPADVKEITAQVFGKVTQVHDILTDEKARAVYQREVDDQIASLTLQAESYIDQGKSVLKNNNYAGALEFFSKAIEFSPESSEAKLHISWCKLKLTVKADEKQELFKQVERDLNQIPPEERHSVMYLFVKGLYQLNMGNDDLAKQFLEQAVSVDPKFIEARRELNIINLKTQQKGRSDQVDLKEVVGRLFKRK